MANIKAAPEYRRNATGYFVRIVLFIGLSMFLVVNSLTDHGELENVWRTVYLPAVWLFWFFNNYLVYMDSISISVIPDGILIRYLFRKRFVPWDDIRFILIGPFQAHFILRKVSLLPVDIISITRNREGFMALMKLIEVNIGDRIKGKPLLRG
jgi:hypothetical protein